MANPRAVPAHLAEHEDDEHGEQRGYIKGTDFALPYFSQWSRLHEADLKDGLLRHVNCGYLSTHGVPPTLLALKQHAQSLCVLIHALNPTLRSAEMGSGGDATNALKYELNDAFDFLMDLTVPYANDDPSHHKPLTALVNEVRGRHEAYRTTYHCPFAETRPRAKGEKQRPYANHHALIMHANACLERLDHEFSSTGGLLSLLPTPPSPDDNDDDNPDLANARNSLLGQWLLFTQHLVARMHELERAYGNALDALAGEAAVPYQHLSRLGPDGRAAGREIAYPQDRWVLVNAGDDARSAVNDALDRQEALLQAREAAWRRNGVVGDGNHISLQQSGDNGHHHHHDDAAARGLVAVTLATRYYRLAGAGRAAPLFVLPAWERHPGVEGTRRIEAEPTVVACAAPKFPARATELERRVRARVARAQRAEAENWRLRDEVEARRAQMETLERQNELLARARDALMLAVGEDGGRLARRVHEQRVRAETAEAEAGELRRQRDEAVGEVEGLREEVDALRREVAELRAA